MKSKTAVLLTLAAAVFSAVFCSGSPESDWKIHALPSSVRIDPVEGRIIEDRPDIYGISPLGSLLDSNWIYDGAAVSLSAARGEYVSFQVVVEAPPGDTLDEVTVEMAPFSAGSKKLTFEPELFLEWAVRVDEKSYGYEKASYGPGWYPDALIPLKVLGEGSKSGRRIIYPLRVPDFVNRVPGQRYLVFWIDQFVPLGSDEAAPGTWRTEVTVSADGHSRSIPVELEVWDFAIPNENNLGGNLQHGGFLRRLDSRTELEIWQLLRRNRIVPLDYGYKPGLQMKSGSVELDWEEFDSRLEKYFTGEAFTEKYGYRGPRLR